MTASVRPVTQLLATQSNDSKEALLQRLYAASRDGAPPAAAAASAAGHGRRDHTSASRQTIRQLYGTAVGTTSAWLQQQSSEQRTICNDVLRSGDPVAQTMLAPDMLRVSALCGGSCLFHSAIAATLRHWAGVAIDKLPVRERYTAAFQNRFRADPNALADLWAAARCYSIDDVLAQRRTVALDLQATLWRACSWSLRLAVVAEWFGALFDTNAYVIALWRTLAATVVCVRVVVQEASSDQSRDALLMACAVAQALLDQTRARAEQMRAQFRDWNAQDELTADVRALVRTAVSDQSAGHPQRLALLRDTNVSAETVRKAAMAWTYDENDSAHFLFDSRAHWIDSTAALPALARVLRSNVHLIDQQCLVTSATPFAQGAALYLYFTGDHFESGVQVDADGRAVDAPILNDEWWSQAAGDHAQLTAIMNGLVTQTVWFDMASSLQTTVAFDNVGKAPTASYADRTRARVRYLVDEWRSAGASRAALQALLAPHYAALVLYMTPERGGRRWLALHDALLAQPQPAPAALAATSIVRTLVPHALVPVLRAMQWLSNVQVHGDDKTSEQVAQRIADIVRGTADLASLRFGHADLHVTLSETRASIASFVKRLQDVALPILEGAGSPHGATWLQRVRVPSTASRLVYDEAQRGLVYDPNRTLTDFVLGTDGQMSIAHLMQEVVDVYHAHAAEAHATLRTVRDQVVALLEQWTREVWRRVRELALTVRNLAERITRYAIARLARARLSRWTCPLQLGAVRALVVRPSSGAVSRDHLRLALTQFDATSAAWPWLAQVHLAANGYATAFLVPRAPLDVQLAALVLHNEGRGAFGTGIAHNTAQVRYEPPFAADLAQLGTLQQRLPKHLLVRYGTFAGAATVDALWFLQPSVYLTRDATELRQVLAKLYDACNVRCVAALNAVYIVTDKRLSTQLDGVLIVDESHLLSPAQLEAAAVAAGFAIPMLDRPTDALQRAQLATYVQNGAWW